jgi:hypothetical protein
MIELPNKRRAISERLWGGKTHHNLGVLPHATYTAESWNAYYRED